MFVCLFVRRLKKKTKRNDNLFFIYIYFFFSITDTTGIPVLMITSEAHSNVTLPCPGVTERSLITTLQWASHTKLVEYMSETTTVWEHRHRINLLSDNFALHFHPVTAEDSGEYSCLVNNRPKPEAIVKLVVQGE